MKTIQSDEAISINVLCEHKDKESGQQVDKERKNVRWENKKDRDWTNSASSQEDFKYVGLKEPFSLPSDAFVSSKDYVHHDESNKTSEPLKLRIQLRYDDTNKSNINDEVTERWADPTPKSRIPEDFLPTATSTSENKVQHDEVSSYGYSRTSPIEHTQADEYYALRHARLSPAFRRALSPELRTRIESRSPLLSRELNDCLAQPPSFYPDYRPLAKGERVESPPNFLAREVARSSSPISRLKEQSSSPNAKERCTSSVEGLRGRGLSSSSRDRDRSLSPNFQSSEFAVQSDKDLMSRTSPHTLRSKSSEDQLQSSVSRRNDLMASQRQDNIR